jgi:UDPglucose 6-dehydrogenase
MKICVIGTGYVGLVTGACLANLGNEVICVDKDQARISGLKKSVIPFYEPGLKEMVVKNQKANRIAFITDIKEGVKRSEVIFIAVGTPPKESGEADVSAVIEVAKQIAKVIKSDGKAHKKYKVIVNKSTVPVGMGDVVTKILVEQGVPDTNFAVVSNPEFLREGTAVSDFMSPDRIVVGASNSKAFNVITELYRPLNAHIIFTTIKSAELIKYASNSFLATKISFINEIANICEKVGSDVVEVAYGMGLDKRIGREFLNAGIGYGGSCLPKDVSALIHLAKSNGYDPQILISVNRTNEEQRKLIIEKMESVLKTLKGKTIGVLGLSFKPETDDLRDAPSLDIIRELRSRGARVIAYDPVAKVKAKKILNGVAFGDTAYDAVKKADAVVVTAEWGEFRELDLDKLRSSMKTPIMFDGRNIYNPKRMKEIGFRYYGVGR